MAVRDQTHLTADALTDPRVADPNLTDPNLTGPAAPVGPSAPGRGPDEVGTRSALSAPRTPPGPIRAALASIRNIWRQLTSMRVALILLFLLALASLPGALLPQWTLNQSKTAQFILGHPFWGPLLDRTGFFDVFASPWYAAIYLLLFTSLVGCLLPRTWDFVGQLRQPPVATPRNLGRLPHHGELSTPGSPDEVADRITAGLRLWRRVRREEITPNGRAVTISAEKGYLREIGNLIFHLSLLGLLVAVAVGKLVGFEGSIIVTAAGGQNSGTNGYCSQTPASYDSFRPGLLVDGTGLTPFCVQVDSFTAQYNDAGQATSFLAKIRYQVGADLASDHWQNSPLAVNDPLRLGGQRLYLLGHGYSPTFTVTFPDGRTQQRTQPFQPQDSTFTSQGALKFTDPSGYTGQDLTKHQLAIVGIFAPTALIHGGIMTSTYPAATKPGVAVDVYQGDLGMEDGAAQSVFAIDQGQVDNGKLVRKARTNLYPHQSVALPDGTKVTFDGYAEWVSLQTSYDPAQGWALVFAALLLLGLMISLIIKRRRVWFRITAVPVNTASTEITGGRAGPARARVEAGGLARTDQAGYGGEFARLLELAALPEGTAGPSARAGGVDHGVGAVAPDVAPSVAPPRGRNP